jgi:hypothetical protein
MFVAAAICLAMAFNCCSALPVTVRGVANLGFTPDDAKRRGSGTISGFPSRRFFRSSAAKRPNARRRVLSGCSSMHGSVMPRSARRRTETDRMLFSKRRTLSWIVAVVTMFLAAYAAFVWMGTTAPISGWIGLAEHQSENPLLTLLL